MDGFQNNSSGRTALQKRKSSELAFAALRLVPSPRYFAKLQVELLVEREQRLASAFVGDCATGGLNPDHSIFVGAEAANTSLARRGRRTGCVILCLRSSALARSVERIAALDTSRKNAVNQASVGRRRNARIGSTTQVRQPSRETNRRIRRVVGNHSGVDSADRSHSRRFVSRHAGAKQVRNSDSCDDQNDSHNDQ